MTEIKFKLKLKEKVTVFVLEMGGCSLLFSTGVKMIAVDCNLLINISGIVNNKQHNDKKENTWWFEFLNSPNFYLNPILSALEGSNQEIPTYDHFCNEFNKGRQILQEFFPKANVIRYSDIHYQAGYELIKEAKIDYESDLKFLLTAVPLVVIRNSAIKLQEIESDIFQIAKDNGLIRPTFALLACLSCLYENNKNPSIGRKVLKPKLRYSRSLAHNALMDLYSLNLLIQSNMQLGNVGFCTSDKGLLRFWCALKVKTSCKSTPTELNVPIELTSEMFEKLNKHELRALKRRIEAFSIEGSREAFSSFLTSSRERNVKKLSFTS